MKSVLRLYLLFLFSLPFTNAQTSQMLKNPDLHTFNINFIEGYALSYNYLTTDKFWLRAELDLYMYGQDTEGDGTQYYRSDASYINGSRSEIDQNSDNNYLQISLSSPILFPIYKSDLGFIYFGAGPKFSYTNQRTTSRETYTNFSPDTVSIPTINKYSNELNNKYYDLGLLALFGISAAITDNISLYAESHFSGGLRWDKSDYYYTYSNNIIQTNGNTSSNHGWFYNIRYVRLGVTISL